MLSHQDVNYEILSHLNDEDLYEACHIDKYTFQTCQYYSQLRNRINHYHQQLLMADQYITEFNHFGLLWLKIKKNIEIPFVKKSGVTYLCIRNFKGIELTPIVGSAHAATIYITESELKDLIYFLCKNYVI